jgi:7,8-dihydropterin-6-yl-methyl-4-(beta-D-ribofuranosyl)aminobenzene 5'-phosphate synthase
MGATRVYVLSDNNSGKMGFRSEHGLSLLIVLANSHQWLWDVGQSSLFLENAAKLGFDLSQLQGLALSHGHYDHTGGLATLHSKLSFRGPIFAHPSFSEARYKREQGATPRNIGLNLEPLVQTSLGFNAVREHCDLDEGLSMCSDIPRRKGLFQAVEEYFFDTEASRPDFVRDDSCLVVHTTKGPVVILGCCHSGLANTLQHLREVTGLKSIHAVIGGLHLLTAREAALQETLEMLREYSIQSIYPCHCTGEKAVRFLKENLPGAVLDIGTGTIIEF